MVTRLRSERQAKGWNLKECAERLGTDPGNLSRIERGAQKPDYDMARRIYDFWGTVPLGAIYDPVFSRERGLDGMVNDNELDDT